MNRGKEVPARPVIIGGQALAFLSGDEAAVTGRPRVHIGLFILALMLSNVILALSKSLGTVASKKRD